MIAVSMVCWTGLLLAWPGRAAARAATPLPVQDDTVTIRIDASVTYQTMEGFGAYTHSLVYGANDMLSPALRQRAIEAVYGQVGLTMGHLRMGNIEQPAGGGEAANDNDDPFTFDWDGFNWRHTKNLKEHVVDPARPLGFTNYSLGHRVDTKRLQGHLKSIHKKDYDRYLDEVAEYVAAGAIHWRDTYGSVPEYMTLFNEPLSGNRELAGGSVQEVVDIVKRAGKRLREEGFSDITFVVPGEETVKKSLRVAQAILADPEARPYVGAIAYHSYPYNSTYARVDGILETSGRGRPVLEEIAVRTRLRDLAARYDLPVWMTEVSMGPGRYVFEFGAFDNLRARAIHIHDELTYANASAYYGMNNMWDRTSHAAHFEGRLGRVPFFSAQSTIALIDQEASEVHISGMGYAIGHYARWIGRGARRIAALSSDSLLQVTAFKDDGPGRIVVVAINNAPEKKHLHLSLAGASIEGRVTGEQSTEETRWRILAPFEPALPSEETTLSVPAWSVTTLALPL